MQNIRCRKGVNDDTLPQPVNFSRQLSEDSSIVAGRRILQALLGDSRGPAGVRLWNGETVIGSIDSPCRD